MIVGRARPKVALYDRSRRASQTSNGTCEARHKSSRFLDSSVALRTATRSSKAAANLYHHLATESFHYRHHAFADGEASHLEFPIPGVI